MAPKLYRTLWMAIDPIHAGVGGYRLGRVDLPIAREPGTNLPKIPGTSLAGAARTYAAYSYGKDMVRCAGKGGEAEASHCGKCEICYTFGHVNREQSYAGTVNLFDAQLICLPVYSMAGPVWVTSRSQLESADLEYTGPDPGNGIVLTWDWKGPLSLGWILLDQAGGKGTVTAGLWDKERHWQTAASRLVIVGDHLLAQIVNSNLEVRTSVSIDPKRGAAEEHALFTYEALPRASVLSADIVVDDYRSVTDGANSAMAPKEILSRGLRSIELLGIGGMGTRGFGRLRLIGDLVEAKTRGDH